MGNCFRQGSKLEADIWELVSAVFDPQSGGIISSVVPGDISSGCWSVLNHCLARGLRTHWALAIVLNTDALHSASV